ncbi:MAG TPA: peptidyl-prolyl cis-trans isomerase, partial [Pirellulales bacterium]|nr:peptidyl-prolyl cis-trans isomerase [Pirellulales bacterium]
ADVLGPVNEILARNADKIPPSQYDTIRENMIRQRLDSLIQTKMVLDVVRRKIPEEGFKKFSEKIGEQFDNMEVPKAMVKSKLNTPKELDEDLRKTGSSLEREKRAYIERQMSLIWVHQNAKSDEEVTHEDMVKYYREHEHEYEYPAKVKWEQILVRFDRCPKSEAYRKLAEAGNKIMDGADFATVAKSVSQGLTASTGGVHDWTTKGSLVSEEVDKALFTLPAGKPSPILEDAKSFQIVRVIERKEAGRTPFTEAQGEIKRQLKGERAQVAMQKYVTEIREQVKVWTIYDEHDPGDLVPAKQKPSDSKTPADAAGPNIAGPAATQPPSTPPAGMPSTPPADAVSGSSPQPYPVAGQAAGSGYPPAGYPITGGGAPPAYPTTSAAPAAGQPGAPRYR